MQNTQIQCGQNVQLLNVNPLNAELNPVRHLLALAGAHHFVHVSRVRVKLLVHHVTSRL